MTVFCFIVELWLRVSMEKYATIIIPRELDQDAVRDIQQMKKKIEEKHGIEIEVVFEEGKQRE